jgi:tetratricopeptide (TPR) repeat protein
MSADVSDARIEKYRLIRLLGSGGMGAVYLAHDPTLDRNVAIKFVAPERLGDAAARRRLIREARAAAALDHPAICAVHEVLTDPPGGGACIVMAYVEGETLADRLKRGPLEVREALSVTTQLTDALAAAHKRGIIHRDIKPQNIMLTGSGRPKLLDFGIAAVREPAEPTQTTETQTDPVGLVPGGTAGYSSPEQVLGGAFDARSDLFSLGAVLFEALTGKRAFNGRTAAEMHAQVLRHEAPAASSLRPELTHEHDELCRQLLAKEPADRFQSAEELLGALRVLTRDTAHPIPHTEAPAAAPAVRRPGRWIAFAGLAVVAALATWWSQQPDPLPAVPERAEYWYRLGTDSVREGAYDSGIRALEEAVKLAPVYPQAHARLADAHSKLDQEREATRALMRATEYVPRLRSDDRIRHEAVQAMLLRDIDRSVAAYRNLTERNPRDRGAWLDLGIALEEAGRPGEARDTYLKAINVDPQYAAAHLRLGSLFGEEGQRDRALQAFAEAERLYKTAGRQEGITEALLKRGSLHDSLVELAEARAALEQARDLSAVTGNMFQNVRARLHLSSVLASEGRFTEATRLASEAVDTARRAGLDTVAATGLIELGATLLYAGRLDEAGTHLNRAIELADAREAATTAMRARVQLAALALRNKKYDEALKVSASAVDFFRSRHIQRAELSALTIMARAHENLGNIPVARDIAGQVLATAERTGDHAQAANALESLAGLSTILGRLPEALAFRERVEEIHKQQQESVALPYDLTNRAHLLIRLGRGTEAEPLLQSVEDGISQRLEAYVGRTRRVRLLRALQAAVNRDFSAVLAMTASLTGDAEPDSTTLHATALRELALAELRRTERHLRSSRQILQSSSPPPDTLQDVLFLHLAAALAREDFPAALDGVSRAFSEKSFALSDEAAWRVAAVGAAAARELEDSKWQNQFAEQAGQTLDRLRKSWGGDAVSYESRPDLVELRKRAGLSPS